MNFLARTNPVKVGRKVNRPMGKAPSRNDQRSRSMNPQDSVGKAAIDNRSVQLNTSQKKK